MYYYFKAYHDFNILHGGGLCDSDGSPFAVIFDLT